MPFLVKLVIMTGQLIAGFVIVLLLILLITFVISRGIQLFAWAFGYEAGSFYAWLTGGIARKLGWRKVKDADNQYTGVGGEQSDSLQGPKAGDPGDRG